MATGPFHYTEAERLTLAVTMPDAINPQKRILRADADPDVIALAQVHATLALAAATATNVMLQLPISSDIATPWAQAIEPVPGQQP